MVTLDRLGPIRLRVTASARVESMAELPICTVQIGPSMSTEAKCG